MSEASEHARLTLVVADFAMVDSQGKVNMVGAGVSVLGFDPAKRTTSRFSVLAQADVPAALSPVVASMELALLRDGEPVLMPGKTGPQAIRIGQAASFEKPQISGPLGLRNRLSSRQQIILDFNTGLPLVPGTAYEWVFQLDGDQDHGIRCPIAVPAAPTGPVIG